MESIYVCDIQKKTQKKRGCTFRSTIDGISFDIIANDTIKVNIEPSVKIEKDRLKIIIEEMEAFNRESINRK